MKTIFISILIVFGIVGISQNRPLDVPYLLPTLDVPVLVEKPVLDGNTSEWVDNWIDIKYSTEASYTNLCSAKFNSGWTKDSLYFAYQVNDNSPHNEDVIYFNDCVSILISMDSSRIWFENEFPNLIVQRTNVVVVMNQKKIALNARVYSKDTKDNYTIELAIPFCNIADYKFIPKNGDVIAFNTSVSDNTGPDQERGGGRTQMLFWNKSRESTDGKVNCGYLRLIGNDPSNIAGTVLAKNNVLTIHGNEAILDKMYTSISVFDITGKLLIRKNNTYRVSLAGLPDGVYLLNNNIQNYKIVKR
jgi:hypothetical protein